jgi:hypothetical protein
MDVKQPSHESVEKPNSKFSLYGGAFIGLFVVAGVVLQLYEAMSVASVYHCEQDIRQCEKHNQRYDCLFKNTAAVPVRTDSFKVWLYDKDDILLYSTAFHQKIVRPNETVHAEFIAYNPNGKIRAIKICSVDPKSDLGRTLPMNPVP